MDSTIHTLIEAGLTPHQATAYVCLVTHGTQSAGTLARKTGIARTLTYRILEELVSLGLAEHGPGSARATVSYTPAHPGILNTLATKKRDEAEQVARAVLTTSATMEVTFAQSVGAPRIAHFTGHAGLTHVYNDMVHHATTKTVLVLCATTPLAHHSLVAMHAHALIARGTFRCIMGEDAGGALSPHGQEIRYLPSGTEVPTEIGVYDDTVVYVTFDGPLVATTLTHPLIAQSVRATLEALWERIPSS